MDSTYNYNYNYHLPAHGQQQQAHDSPSPLAHFHDNSFNEYAYSHPYAPVGDGDLAPGVKIHAPIPLAGQSPLLYTDLHTLDSNTSSSGGAFDAGGSEHLGALETTEYDDQDQDPRGHELDFELAARNALCEPQDVPVDQSYLGAGVGVLLPPGVTTFPTPSELLEELAVKGLGVNVMSEQTFSQTQMQMPRHSLLPSGVPAENMLGSDFASCSGGSDGDLELELDASDVRLETARKARRRAMAKSVGFEPTDPDTITSHDKKRHYLECLEQYILYLHRQYELLGKTPPRIELVRPIPSKSGAGTGAATKTGAESIGEAGGYRGLASRSIRTLLVHMEHNTRSLNVRTLAEEQRFMGLRDEVYARDAGRARSGAVMDEAATDGNASQIQNQQK